MVISSFCFGQTSVDSIGALKNITGVSGSWILVTGFYSKNDGGGDLFFWNDTARSGEIYGWNPHVTGVYVGQWQRAWLGGPLDSKWFGAHYDGITDDRPYLQAEIDLSYNIGLSNNGRMPWIRISSGNYLVGTMAADGKQSNLFMYAGQYIFGDKHETFITRKGGTTDSLGYTIQCYSFGLSSDSTKNNLYISDLEIIGATKGRYGNHALGVGGDGGIFLGVGLSPLLHLNVVNITDVVVRNMSMEGIGVRGASLCIIRHCGAFNMNFDAFNPDACRTIIMENPYGDSLNFGIEAYNGYSSNLAASDSNGYTLISHPVFTNVFEHGIHIKAGKHIIIDNPILVGAYNWNTTLTYQSIGIFIDPKPAAYFDFPGNADGIGILEVNNPHIYNFVTCSIGTSTLASTDKVVEEVDIKGGSLEKSGMNAIVLQGYDNTKFKKVVISNVNILDWNRLNPGNAFIFTGIYLSNIRNADIKGNRFSNTNPNGLRNDPLCLNSCDSIAFYNNNCWGYHSFYDATLTIKQTGVNTNLLVYNNPGLAFTTESIVAPATSGTMTTVMDNIKQVTITPTGGCTFNASGGLAPQTVTFVVTTSGTISYTLQWGTNFKTIGSLSTGTVSGKVFTITFSKSGTNWYEVGRTAAM